MIIYDQENNFEGLILTEENETIDHKSKILEVEDKIIVKFCELVGGMEIAMPMVRKQYEKLNVNFKEPTLNDLHKISENLVELTEKIKGENLAREQRKYFKDLLRKFEDGIQ